MLIHKFYVFKNIAYISVKKKKEGWWKLRAVFKHGPQSLAFLLYKGKLVKWISVDEKVLVGRVKGWSGHP